MEQSPSPARIVVGAAVGSALLFYFIAGVLRVWSPIPLNDMELTVLAHVRRLSSGLPIYAPPDVHFVALVYMPLFYYASMAAVRLVGDGLVALRLVSLAASLATCWLTYRIVRVESGSRNAGLIAAGLRAALGADVGWVALARVDALMECLFLAGVYRMRVSRGSLGLVGAGMLFGLAVLTKQSALLMCVPVILWQVWTDRRRGVMLGAACAITVALLCGSWEWESGGWFGYYTFYLAGNQYAGGLLSTVQMGTTMLLRMVPFAVLAPALLLVRSFRERLELSAATAMFYLAVAAATFFGCLTSELIHGSVNNVLILPCGWLLMLFAICGERIVRVTRRSGDRGWAQMAAAVTLAQFLALAYVPAKLIGGVDDPAAAGIPVVTISGATRPGGVIRTRHISPLQRLDYADGYAVQDLLTGGTPEVTRRFEQRVRRAICHASPRRPVVLSAEVAAMDGAAALSPVWACDAGPHQLE
jgi:4-amino-4-deoxy-L-arabinose transferase-like glycosyltransferase